MAYLPFICYILGSLCFVDGRPRVVFFGPWLFIAGSVIAMVQLP